MCAAPISPRCSTSVVPISYRNEIALAGDREDDSLPGILDDAGVFVLEQLLHDEVAALDQAPRLALRRVRVLDEDWAAQGPLALTSVRALKSRDWPLESCSRICHRLALRRASTQAHRAITVAPCSWASMALSTTCRASSTQPSE